MRNIDSRTLAFGVAMLILGGVLLYAAANPIMRYAGGISAFAIGLGAVRYGLRLE
ncbi:hypothetical protein [Sphingomonas crusticola]|uniref:hypothetical protein n=1 Tax=Sphingomonas crusticola TaxID=1697973 RepID=UPI0013C2E5AD|nr:hypothetical protein [Sphingomonas crusticola]